MNNVQKRQKERKMVRKKIKIVRRKFIRSLYNELNQTRWDLEISHSIANLIIDYQSLLEDQFDQEFSDNFNMILSKIHKDFMEKIGIKKLNEFNISEVEIGEIVKGCLISTIQYEKFHEEIEKPLLEYIKNFDKIIQELYI